MKSSVISSWITLECRPNSPIPVSVVLESVLFCINLELILSPFTSAESESNITTECQSASLSWNKAPVRGLRPDVCYYQDGCGFVDVGRSLWRENGSVVYKCFSASPAQSCSDLSDLEVVTIFYCLRFDTSLFVASYDSQGYGGGIRTRLRILVK
jgi:hypothetical protein